MSNLLGLRRGGEGEGEVVLVTPVAWTGPGMEMNREVSRGTWSARKVYLHVVPRACVLHGMEGIK